MERRITRSETWRLSLPPEMKKIHDRLLETERREKILVQRRKQDKAQLDYLRAQLQREKDSHQQDLAKKQKEVDDAYSILWKTRQEALQQTAKISTQEALVTAKQKELDEANKQLKESREEAIKQTAIVTGKQKELDEVHRLLKIREEKLTSQTAMASRLAGINTRNQKLLDEGKRVLKETLEQMRNKTVRANSLEDMNTRNRQEIATLKVMVTSLENAVEAKNRQPRSFPAGTVGFRKEKQLSRFPTGHNGKGFYSAEIPRLADTFIEPRGLAAGAQCLRVLLVCKAVVGNAQKLTKQETQRKGPDIGFDSTIAGGNVVGRSWPETIVYTEDAIVIVGVILYR
ncbi:hypothetical protein QBC38DRAFT_446676 [Podospora fimiseda]|uniref:PARP catalytic domain-containing protein n=1 Tax=Podospora fimiseda TaxID=252190 RepID=A0AAN7GPW7_9PEZI|nr:hypothetical protein QBC38DRAFT_446676 [Podospora fimiseda]